MLRVDHRCVGVLTGEEDLGPFQVLPIQLSDHGGSGEKVT